MNNLKKYVGIIVEEVLKESAGKEPTKEQISATFDLLKSLIKQTGWSGKVYAVGGAVRDMVMGLDPKDIDLVVEMEDGGIKFANYVAQRLGIYRSSNPVVFPKFGTAKLTFDGVVHNGVPLDGVDVEVVYTREETYEPGSRKPTTKYGSIKSDVMRRDLTINSLLMDLVSGEIVDLTGKGKEDIEKGVIRTPTDPDIIFAEDPLRLMRAVRFAGRYNYTMPDFMKKSIKDNSEHLNLISRERVREELEKILKGSNPEVSIGYLYELGLMPYVISSIKDREAESKNAAKSGKDFIEKMALMLKKTALPEATKALKDLKFSNDEISAITKIVEAIQLVNRNQTLPSMIKAGADLHASGNENYVSVLENENKDLYSKGKKYFNNGPVIHFPPNDLIKVFNMKPGPLVGKIMAFQKNLWYNNPEISKNEATQQIKQEFKI
jgi:poly(A) polymerase